MRYTAVHARIPSFLGNGKTLTLPALQSIQDLIRHLSPDTADNTPHINKYLPGAIPVTLTSITGSEVGGQLGVKGQVNCLHYGPLPGISPRRAPPHTTGIPAHGGPVSGIN